MFSGKSAALGYLGRFRHVFGSGGGDQRKPFLASCPFNSNRGSRRQPRGHNHESFNVPFSSSHKLPHIPYQHPLIPSASGTPTFGTEKAPINTHGKFGVCLHPTHFSCSLSHDHRFGVSNAHTASVCPYATCHIVACAQQHIAQMWTPTDLSDRVFMPWHHSSGSRARRAQVERPNHTVHAGRSNNCVSVFVPIVCQAFGRAHTLRDEA